MNRAEMLQRLRGEPGDWDVLVIGGGASGLATAVESAARGYRTALVEQADFAQATSSRSTKLIHGGIRYLEQGAWAGARIAARTGPSASQRAASGPSPALHPAAVRVVGASVLRRGAETLRQARRRPGIEACKHLSRVETLERMPTLAGEGLRGGIVYQDGQFDDARLAITLAQTAVDLGGAVVNYVKVVSLLKQNGRVSGATVREVEGGDEFEVRARVVLMRREFSAMECGGWTTASRPNC